MKNNRLSLSIASLLCLFAISACEMKDYVYFDTPFVTITDEARLSSSQSIDKNANNMLTVLWVDINISNNKFTEDVTVEYEVICGDGLKEGVDYVIQQTTKSPLVFEKGTRSMPVRLMWKKNKDFQPDKDNTLVIKLKSSSMEDMVIGYPGPDAIRSKFTFTKN